MSTDQVHRVNDSTAAPNNVAADQTTAGDRLRADAGMTGPVDLYKGNRNEVAAAAAPASPDAKGDRVTSAPTQGASAADAAFGRLQITDEFKAVGADKPLSPNMQEARRIEGQYRERYQANDEAMRAVNGVMGANNPDINGTITKEGLDKALTNAKSADPADKRYGKDFQEAAEYMKNNWNDMTFSPYKGKDGSVTTQSAADGTTRMKGEQDQIAKQILKTEMNAANLDKAQQPAAPAPEAPPAPAVVPKDAMIKQGMARVGEGPHQVAARVLGSDGHQLNDKQLKELTNAFKATYEDERKANPKLHALDGLKVGHEFINKDNINNVLSKISDPALKERLTKIAGQDVAYKPPVISAIPHRPAAPVKHEAAPVVHRHQPHQLHNVPLPPVRPVGLR